MKRFFIIGNPRSGTTLFRLMLNKHSKISVPPEAGFLVWLNNKYNKSDFDYKLFLIDLKTTNKIETWNIDFEELYQVLCKKKPISYSALIDCVYYYYSKYILNRKISIYGDKNNYYLDHIDIIQSLYPDAKFIHIIRDGRSVAASYKGVMSKNINGKYAPKLPTKISDIATQWVENIDTITKNFVNIDKNNKYVMRYEDLILNPTKTLESIVTFLGVDFEENMLEYYTTSEKEGLEPKEYMGWKSKNLMPINIDEVEKYKLLSDSEIKIFENYASDTLVKYNYMKNLN